ncbi:isoprenylcysteine carboxylmethyltransferase family protein [Solirubrobacter ginsenosidimutans]|uniref:Isoprenylcysteine carboxylmethyltransferase family protein n=1 Tax=Solirubrobacter ginsenosidimutans TaxID=490573 RepID=A0A9X3S343_9ACTN|nr:isoprenylcysteine carboxylmethyltransferase family protein [Solirubrobacter ginsenosidimutans]MDA0163052.1 isoprenylcysteine carboxylmethyltransferase family protein [Solirubrobacter ginsenosidimutans]
MAPLPYTDPGAKIAFFAVLGVFVVLEQRIRLKSRFNRHGTREDRGSLLVVVVAVAAGVAGGCVVAGAVPSAAIAVARWPIFVLGVLLMCAGIALRQWAVALLGEFFTVDIRVHPEQVVVERGPYRRVRHPSYTGMLVTFLGIGLALGNWAALALLVVVPAAGFVVRIRVEERALLAGLGEPYRRFATTRARLIPGIW